jgi:hypothetical protein
MIWTLRIACVRGRYQEGEWIRCVELDSTSTLLDLHDLIQEVIRFDRDHLFEFFGGRNDRHRSVTFDGAGDEDGASQNDDAMPLEQVFPLPKNLKLYYHFDFGDDWIFEIRKTRAKPKEPAARVKCPRVIEKIGPNPRQYGRY